ncbi:S8 family serine peptidase [Streptomyces platensis]|uniref:S8 family serine peptidase n=1 Tax=Streptomyces platensis TaxID=58346 RepID=UPI003328A439
MNFTRTLCVVGGAMMTGALFLGSAPTASADQIRDGQWPLKSFDAESVWQLSTGKGVTVAVIDDPVNGDHPDLKGNVLPGKDLDQGGPANQEDQDNHGTSMASIIAGHGHGAGNSEGVKGLAPEAKILPVGITPEDEISAPSSGGLAKAVNYAVSQGASVINMSFGQAVLSEDDKQALRNAINKNVFLVVATGNDGMGKLDQLTSYPGVVAVGAVDKTGKVWEDSNYGPQTMLTAPGTFIRSAGANKPYVLANGTSDSAAYVSGAAALLRSKFPGLTAGQIANRLVKTAGLPPGKEGMELPDPHYGYGFIRPYSALTKNVPTGSKNGPLKTPKADPAAGGASAPGTSGSAGDEASQQMDSGLGTGAIMGIAVGVLIVVAIIIIVVRQKKNDRNGSPPGGFGGPGGPGFAPQQPGPFQQPGPYQQPGPFQHQSSAPGAVPPAPPTPPPGQ